MVEDYQHCPKCKKNYLIGVHKKCPDCKVELKIIKGDEKEKKKEEHLGRRVLAFLIDIYGLPFGLGIILYPFFEEENFPFIFIFIVYIAYTLFKDALFEGQSIGKKITGLKVVDYETRKPCTYWQSFKRNIVLDIPFVILIEAYTILFDDNRRWGDNWAGTEVIRIK